MKFLDFLGTDSRRGGAVRKSTEKAREIAGLREVARDVQPKNEMVELASTEFALYGADFVRMAPRKVLLLPGKLPGSDVSFGSI